MFISYSWESTAHKEWVRNFAARLMSEGVKVTLDQWHAVPGDQLPELMEREIRDNRYILIICTPYYKERADKRVGGVGYEGDIMTAEVLGTKSRRKQRKFIPILRTGNWRQAAPSWLQGKYRIHLDGDPYPEEQYQDLLATLHDARPKPPPLGPRPEKYQIQELRKQLESEDVDERLLAIKGLRKIGPAAVPTLVAALQDAAASVRRRAAEALGGIGPAAEAAVPALVAALQNDRDAVREAAARALEGIGPAAVPALVAALQHDVVRHWAARALRGIGPAAVPALTPALHDADAGMLGMAFNIVEGIGPAAVPALIAALQDDNASVRRWAAIALGRIGPAAEAAVPALVAALQDGDAVRHWAADALKRIDPASSDTT